MLKTHIVHLLFRLALHPIILRVFPHSRKEKGRLEPINGLTCIRHNLLGYLSIKRFDEFPQKLTLYDV